MYKAQIYTVFWGKIATPEQVAHFNASPMGNSKALKIFDRILNSDNDINDKDRNDFYRLMNALDEDRNGSIDLEHSKEFAKIQKKMVNIMSKGYMLENGEASYPTLKIMMEGLLQKKMPDMLPKWVFRWNKTHFKMNEVGNLNVFSDDKKIGFIDTNISGKFIQDSTPQYRIKNDS